MVELLKPKPKRSEASVQFESIWEDFYSPETRERLKLLKNRLEREERNKTDNGL
jgi:hypothetical protein